MIGFDILQAMNKIHPQLLILSTENTFNNTNTLELSTLCARSLSCLTTLVPIILAIEVS